MNETPSRIEPLFFEDSVPRPIADLVGEVQREAMSLGRDLHPDAAAELAEFVSVDGGENPRINGAVAPEAA